MFHSVAIKPGAKHVSQLGMVWHISSVALDKSATLSAKPEDSKKATAVSYLKEGTEHTLCTLRPLTCEQERLNLTIAPEQSTEFSVSGAFTIHLSGTLSFEDDGDSDGYGSDNDEGMSGLMGFDDDDDDDDDDDSEDSDDDSFDESCVSMKSGEISYGSMALAAMAQGADLGDEDDDSEDDGNWDEESDEDDDSDDEFEDDEDDSDAEPRIRELTQEELEAYEKSQGQRSKRMQKAVKAAPAKTGKPAASKAEEKPKAQAKTPVKSEHHGGDGEPNAKRKLLADTPKSEEKKKPQQSPASAKKEAQSPAQPLKLPGGMTAKTIKQGNGKGTKAGQRVFVRYRGRLAHNNKEFDSNMSSGKPFAFRLGKGEVIKGWDEGVKGMKAGEVRELKIPPALGYGARGAPPSIPSNATLLFTVELLRFK